MGAITPVQADWIRNGDPSQHADRAKGEVECNVKAFGAKGDNSADDTAAFQRAIAFITAQGGGAIAVPHGTYKISSADLLIKDLNEWRVYGPGQIVFASTYGFSIDNCDRWKLDGLHLTGSGNASQALIAVHRTSARWLIEGCKLFTAGYGIYVTDAWIGEIRGGMADNSLAYGIYLTHGTGDCLKGTPYGNLNAISITGQMEARGTTACIQIGDESNGYASGTHCTAVTIAPEVTIEGSGVGVVLENSLVVNIGGFFEAGSKGILLQGYRNHHIAIGNCVFQGATYDPAIDASAAHADKVKGLSIQNCRFINSTSTLNCGADVIDLTLDRNTGLGSYTVNAATNVRQGVNAEVGHVLSRYVLANSNVVLTAADSGRILTNSAHTAGRTVTLPASAAGMVFGVVKEAAQNFYIDPNGAETIRGGGAGKQLRPTNVGDMFELRCFTAGVWELCTLAGAAAFEP